MLEVGVVVIIDDTSTSDALVLAIDALVLAIIDDTIDALVLAAMKLSFSTRWVKSGQKLFICKRSTVNWEIVGVQVFSNDLLESEN